MIRVVLPAPLQRLANVGREVDLQLEPPLTQRALIDALEAQYPVLRGTLRDPSNQKRRDFIRFFAAGEDLSLEPLDAELPEPVVQGLEKFYIVGAMAGG